MLDVDKSKKELVALKISCQVCGLTFANENEKQKHVELEHMKKKKPAGVR
ncbi:MAG: hypothetical protein MN733_09780 [Nitrososphaera sp.]|nr:hypothetical protein [Nitrososphaera sp.]